MSDYNDGSRYAIPDSDPFRAEARRQEKERWAEARRLKEQLRLLRGGMSDAQLRDRMDEMVGPVPLLAPGDREAARQFLEKVEGAIAAKGWTPAQWNRLYRLRDKWQDRAAGRDIRFEVMGNAARRPTPKEQDDMRLLAATRDIREIASGNV